MITKLRVCLLSCLVLCCVLPTRAYEIIFSQLSTNNGLASNFVNCVGQSANGYIWVGTPNGLQRYDGYRFTPTIRSSKKNRLPPLPVNQIFRSDDPQKLWLRMGHTIGLFDISDYTFSKVEVANSAEFVERFDFKLSHTYNGQMLLLIEGHGILVYNKAKNKFESQPSVINYPSDWKPRAIYADRKNGLIWLPSFLGLGCFDVKTKQFYTANHNPKKLFALQLARNVKGIKNLTIDGKGRFFLNSWPRAAEYQTYLLDPRKNKLDSVSYEKDQSSNYSELLQVDEINGLIWGHGSHAFNIFDEDERRFTVFYDARNTSYGIKVSEIYQLFADRDQNIWVATDNGLYIASILNHEIRNGTTPYFGDADVTFVMPLFKDQVLMGSWGSKIKILKYDQKLNITENNELLKSIYKGCPADGNYTMVWSAIEAKSSHEIWFGCQGGRLIAYNTVQKRSTFLKPSMFNEGTIRSIAQDADENLWFGLQNGLLIKKSSDTFKVVADLDHKIISKILVDRHQNLWIATVGRGLLYFDTQSEKIVANYKVRPDGKGLSTNHVKDILQLNDSTMVIACTANLDLLNLRTKKIEQFTMEKGLPQQSITSLQRDQQGYVWMSTIGGIVRFDPYRRFFRSYDQKDGLKNSSNLADLLQNSAMLQNGYLIFTGAKNFMIFNPKFLNRALRPVHPVITEFKLFNSFLSVDSIKKRGVIELPYDKNSIAISFAALSYLQSNKLKYFYKLAGANENWFKAENAVSATFASLAPGKYTFMVKAQNSDGVFSPTANLNIHILPAFWQTWWFITLVVIISFIPFYLIYRLRLNRLIEVQKIREKVARDLHDDMGSTLTSINILSVMANGKVEDEPDTVRDYLGRISQNSSQMMESMDDIVWSIKPSNDQLSRIVARMREYTANILEPQDIRYEFITNDNGSNIKLDMEARRNLFLIFKEALNNISKYSKADKVTISLNYQRGMLQLCIKDNGVGFEMRQRADGNGLINMRKRTELLKGTIEIHSAVHQGTQILIKLPLT